MILSFLCEHLVKPLSSRSPSKYPWATLKGWIFSIIETQTQTLDARYTVEVGITSGPSSTLVYNTMRQGITAGTLTNTLMLQPHTLVCQWLFSPTTLRDFARTFCAGAKLPLLSGFTPVLVRKQPQQLRILQEKYLLDHLTKNLRIKSALHSDQTRCAEVWKQAGFKQIFIQLLQSPLWTPPNCSSMNHSEERHFCSHL